MPNIKPISDLRNYTEVRRDSDEIWTTLPGSSRTVPPPTG
mgnify:CR=1 FL=1